MMKGMILVCSFIMILIAAFAAPAMAQSESQGFRLAQDDQMCHCYFGTGGPGHTVYMSKRQCIQQGGHCVVRKPPPPRGH